MGKYILSVFLLLVINISSHSVSGQENSGLILFPENRVFPAIFLDPLECQVAGGSYLLSQRGENISLYSTVNFGFNEPVIAKHGNLISWELNFGSSCFSQFDLIKKNDGSFLAGLLNTDFKLTADYSIQKSNNLLRIRVFHVSSHLGDDYLARHSDSLINDKSVNYEQVDLTYLRKYGNSFFYAAAGGIYTRYVFRRRYSFQGGGMLSFGKSRLVNFFTGIDIKLMEENNFSPDIRSAIGLNFNRNIEPFIRVWAEYYSGRLPYSTIDYGRVNWFGLAMRLNVF